MIGSIPTGYWLGRIWKGIDIRQQGSGNVGATNVLRLLGKGPAALTLVIDILKGVLPVLWIERQFPGMTVLAVAAGLAAIVGHMTSPFVGFRGGKGVATSAGVFAALLPLSSMVALLTFGACLAVTRWVSLSSILGALALAISAVLLSPSPLLRIASGAAAVLILWKHRANVLRLWNGTEPRLGQHI
jgi:glycerol-3-phosphate acyltransferase PlsY